MADGSTQLERMALGTFVAEGQHIVILGSGLAGRYAAQHLAYKLCPQDRITLVDRNNYLLYSPFLPEILRGTISAENIKISVETLPARVEFLQACVCSLDVHRKRAWLDGERTIDATQLILALGSVPDNDVPGAREYGMTMKSLADVVRIQ